MPIRHTRRPQLAAAIALLLPAPAAATNAPADAALVEAGRKQFVRCVSCHAVTRDVRPGTPPAMGPNLAGIVGRVAGGDPDFAYATALKDGRFTWTRKRLDQWLRQPQKDIAGLCLPFTGLPRKADRKALIAYLESPPG